MHAPNGLHSKVCVAAIGPRLDNSILTGGIQLAVVVSRPSETRTESKYPKLHAATYPQHYHTNQIVEALFLMVFIFN